MHNAVKAMEVPSAAIYCNGKGPVGPSNTAASVATSDYRSDTSVNHGHRRASVFRHRLIPGDGVVLQWAEPAAAPGVYIDQEGHGRGRRYVPPPDIRVAGGPTHRARPATEASSA